MPILPFGKHRGVPIEIVSDSYLQWCVSDPHQFFAARPGLKSMIDDEVVRRQTHHISIKEDPPVQPPAVGTPSSAVGDEHDPEAEEVVEGIVKPMLEDLFHGKKVEPPQEKTPTMFGGKGQRGLRYGELKRIMEKRLAEFIQKNGPELNQSPHINAGAKGFAELLLASFKEKLCPTNDVLTEDD